MIRVVAAGQLHQGRIAGVYRIGIAHEHLAVREHDIVIAAGLGRNGVGQRLADRAVFGIDDAQRRIAVLVLQRPDLAGNRIELQTIDIAADLIGMGVIIFDDGAVTRQWSRRRWYRLPRCRRSPA
jgi:hypothetical protein